MQTKVKTIIELKDFFESKQTDELNLIIFDENGITFEGFQMIDFLTKNIDNLKDNVQNIIVTIPYEKLPKSQFKKFYNLYKKSASQNRILNFCVKHFYREGFRDLENDVYWDFETILKANSSIDKVCSFLKSSGLSPLEMLAYIHDYVSTIAEYRWSQDENHGWHNKDQFFAGAYLKIPENVCMCQSTLMKEIIDNLNMPELQCEVITVEFEQLAKHYIASHARCLVKIKDQKYGLDQVVFDDPTWDNDDNPHKYCHFAMPNNTHEKEANGLYLYFCPNKMVFSNQKAKKEVVDLNPYYENYNNSKNQINQKMVETAYFNMLTKKYKNRSFEFIYKKLKKMAQNSFEEQTYRKFKGNLTQPDLIILQNLQKSVEETNQLKTKNHKDDYLE